MESALARAALRNRLRRALLNHETLEHEHAKLGYRVQQLERQLERLQSGGGTLLERDEAEYLLYLLPKLKGRPTTVRRSVEDKLLDALASAD